MDTLDKQIVFILQDEIPCEKEPFKKMAEKLNIPEYELLSRIEKLQEQGVIRRIGAVLYHQKAGYRANAMVVWAVPEERIEAVGKIMASQDRISHCYQRPTFPGWPYNLFSMVHAKTQPECDAFIGKLALDLEIETYEVLYSVKELKKTSMRYFDPA